MCVCVVGGGAVKMDGAQKCTTLNNYVRNCIMPFIQQEFSS